MSHSISNNFLIKLSHSQNFMLKLREISKLYFKVVKNPNYIRFLTLVTLHGIQLTFWSQKKPKQHWNIVKKEKFGSNMHVCIRASNGYASHCVYFILWEHFIYFFFFFFICAPTPTRIASTLKVETLWLYLSLTTIWKWLILLHGQTIICVWSYFLYKFIYTHL